MASTSLGVQTRRRAVADLPWAWLEQVHGANVAVVSGPGFWGQADAAVTTVPCLVLAVQVADCVPLVLIGQNAVGVVHAGWRGMQAGVVEAAFHTLQGLSPGPVRAVIGPCIRAECYEFDHSELEVMTRRWGDAVVAKTAWGSPALDLERAAISALAECGVSDVEDSGICTSCSPRHWSWRSEKEARRHAGAAWLEAS